MTPIPHPSEAAGEGGCDACFTWIAWLRSLTQQSSFDRTNDSISKELQGIGRDAGFMGSRSDAFIQQQACCMRKWAPQLPSLSPVHSVQSGGNMPLLKSVFTGFTVTAHKGLALRFVG